MAVATPGLDSVNSRSPLNFSTPLDALQLPTAFPIAFGSHCQLYKLPTGKQKLGSINKYRIVRKLLMT
jgi:hypothetical protein